MAKIETYEIKVTSAVDTGKVNVTIDGEESVADGFEFSAPLGSGLMVKKVVRVELVKEDKEEKPWTPQKY